MKCVVFREGEGVLIVEAVAWWDSKERFRGGMIAKWHRTFKNTNQKAELSSKSVRR